MGKNEGNQLNKNQLGQSFTDKRRKGWEIHAGLMSNQFSPHLPKTRKTDEETREKQKRKALEGEEQDLKPYMKSRKVTSKEEKKKTKQNKTERHDYCCTLSI